MNRFRCARCGQPLRQARTEGAGRDRAGFCCLGCVLRAAVPVDADGNFPVNRPLAIALGIGFVAFNQFLCWAMSAVAVGKGRSSLAQGFLRAEFTFALFVLTSIVVLQLATRTQRGREWILSGVALALVARACVQPTLAGAWLGLATVLICCWSIRGIFRSTAYA